MINPIYAYIAGGALLAGAAAGWTVRDWRCDAAVADALAAAAKAEDRADAAIAEAAKVYENNRTNIATAATRDRVIVQEIYRDIEVPAECAVDPAAISVLEGARQRANAAAAGQPVAAVPVAGPASQPAD